MKMTKSNKKKCSNKWTEGIIYRIVRNVVYTGNIYKRKSIKEDYRKKKRDYIRTANRIIISNTHPAIIDEKTFNKANLNIKTNIKTNRLIYYSGYLNGLVKCGECGKVLSISGRKKENGRIVYQFYCTEGKNKNKECSNSKSIFTNKLEDIIFNTLLDYINNANEQYIINKAMEDLERQRQIKNEIQMLNRDIAIKKNDLKYLYMQKADNRITEEFFKEKRKEIKEQIKKQETKHLKKNDCIEKKIQYQKVREQFSLFKKNNNLMKYIGEFINKITFYENRAIEIKFKFSNKSL